MNKKRELPRGAISTREARHMLGVGENEFSRLSREKDTKLLSKKKGKWVLSSVKQEFQRIHGEKYEIAIQ